MNVSRWLGALVCGGMIVTASLAGGQEEQGRYRQFGDAGGFLNILPPGSDGVLNGPEAIAAQAGQFPPHFNDQLSMYGDLVHVSPGLTEDRILEFFKDASFGVPEDDIDRVYSPTEGVVVVRDASFGVPHIFGETRYATMFAQGYTAAEDRLFLMDALRHVGRARLSEFIGASAANQQLDREQLAVAPYLEQDLTDQIDAAVAAAGAEGQAILDDLLAYVDGVNQYINEALADNTKMPAEYPALQQTPQPWIPEDAVAIASLVGGIFGKGGGGELRNHCGLKAMAAELGDAGQARAVFDDLKFADDAEAPTTAPGSFPYMDDLGPVDPSAHPDIDCDSLAPIDPQGPLLDDLLAAIAGDGAVLGLPAAISNALLVGGEHTESGRPIAVFGPQTSYYAPQLLVEKDVHGPGIDARGASFAGVDLYVQLGRGRDYAWSATSAGADNVDQFVLRLCEPGGGQATVDSMGYEHDGQCLPIEAYDHVQIAKPSAGGIPGIEESGAQCDNDIDDEGDGVVNDGCPAVGLPELLVFCLDAVDSDADGAVNDGCPPVAGPDIVLSWPVERTEHYGPLVARGMLEDGTPIAVATLRTTYMNELGSARGFARINNPDFMTDGFDSFREAMGQGVDYTFNWFYIDDRDIGYQHSCLCPQRAPGVDPYLPAWGTGQWDWQGFTTFADQPFALNPPAGFLSSWNNKQAPGFRSNDREFSYGPVYRSDMLDVRLEALVAAGDVVRTDVIDAMEDAGTVDLRGQEVLPVVLEVLGPSAPPAADPRVQEMRDRLAAWVGDGAHRRDFDDDGSYDDPQSPAIMDAWWEPLVRAVFDAPSGDAIDALGLTLDDANRRNHIGSAFQSGFYGHIDKDLRQVLGQPVSDPFSRSYCGGGDLATCRAALRDSLETAIAALELEFSSMDVADWRREIADEDVRHTGLGVVGVKAIHWINRPTFQQVVQIPERTSFKCYKTRRAPGSGKFTRQTVDLADEFESKQTLVLKPDSICNAVAIGGESIETLDRHLACYRIKDATGQPRLAKRDVLVGDRFGSGRRTVKRARTLCVPGSVDGAPAGPGGDAYKCYKASKAKGSARIERTQAVLEDVFGSKASRILKPVTVCNPVDQDGAGIADDGAHLACYKIKDDRGEPRFARREVSVADGFGGAQRSVIKPTMVCVSSVQAAP